MPLVQFIDAETDTPLLTFRDKKADFLFAYSDLVKNFAEFSKNNSTAVIPISRESFPTDRRDTFFKILQGYPMGVSHSVRFIDWYPLGPLEEAEIAAVVDAQMIADGYSPRSHRRPDYLRRERENVIYEILSYLLLPIDKITEIIETDYAYENRGLLNDKIDELVENHTKWLYLKRAFEDLTNAEQMRMEKYFKENPPFTKTHLQFTPLGTENGDTRPYYMTPKQYEKFLRTEYMRTPQIYDNRQRILPRHLRLEPLPQQNYGLRNLFGNNQNAFVPLPAAAAAAQNPPPNLRRKTRKQTRRQKAARKN